MVTERNNKVANDKIIKITENLDISNSQTTNCKKIAGHIGNIM